MTSFTFSLSKKDFSEFTNKETGTLMQKWDMQASLLFTKLSFEEIFSRSDASSFFVSMLNSPDVRQVFQVRSRSGWAPISGDVKNVEIEELSANVVSMSFFDRLYTDDLVRENGSLAKCFDVFLDNGITASNNLRKLLLCEDESDFAGLFEEKEKKELMYQIFRTICIGGGMNQFEDSLAPYLDVCKKIYKTLVRVQKNQHSGEPEIPSVVYMLKNMECANVDLFPVDDAPNNTCFVSVDPLGRTVNICYFAFIPAF